MQPEPYLKTLRLTGCCLLAGVIVLVLSRYTTVKLPNGWTYSGLHVDSTLLGVLLFAAGGLLLRGSLRAVGVIGWLAALALPVYAGLAVLELVLQPLGLTFVELRLIPVYLVKTVGLYAVTATVLGVVLRALRSQVILDARTEYGLKIHSLRLPLILGAVTTVVYAVALLVLLEGEQGAHAATVASQSLGPGYRYWANRIMILRGPLGTRVSASVVAYNDHAIRVVPVQWSEPLAGMSAQTQTTSNMELPATGQQRPHTRSTSK